MEEELQVEEPLIDAAAAEVEQQIINTPKLPENVCELCLCMICSLKDIECNSCSICEIDDLKCYHQFCQKYPSLARGVLPIK